MSTPETASRLPWDFDLGAAIQQQRIDCFLRLVEAEERLLHRMLSVWDISAYGQPAIAQRSADLARIDTDAPLATFRLESNILGLCRADTPLDGIARILVRAEDHLDETVTPTITKEAAIAMIRGLDEPKVLP